MIFAAGADRSEAFTTVWRKVAADQVRSDSVPTRSAASNASTLRAMIARAGFSILERCADGGFPLARRLGPWLGALIDQAALARFPGLFGFQLVWRCQLASPTAHGLPDMEADPAHAGSFSAAAAALALGTARLDVKSSPR